MLLYEIHEKSRRWNNVIQISHFEYHICSELLKVFIFQEKEQTFLMWTMIFNVLNILIVFNINFESSE